VKLGEECWLRESVLHFVGEASSRGRRRAGPAPHPPEPLWDAPPPCWPLD